jgi:DNA-binding CsgD family transcriptional regulator
MKRLQFYQEYAKPFDMAHCMMRGTGQIAASGRYVMMAPSHQAQGVPSSRQRQVFEMLTAHAERALAMSLRLNAAGEALEGAWSLMDRSDCGIVLANKSGAIAAANDVARRMDGDGFRIVDGMLMASMPGQRAEFDRLLGAALRPPGSQGAVGPLALKRQNGKRPLLVNAVPVRNRLRDLFPACLASASIVVVIIDLDKGTAPTASSLFRLLGLTAKEACVAALLGACESPETVARELSLSIGTVRNHIKRIFSKLDISRQSELVALASKLAILPHAEG